MPSDKRRHFLGKLALILLALCAQVVGQAGPLEPLPQDTGGAGLKQMLRKLGTTGRLLQIDAHPDDEDGGMLTLEARGKGITTVLLTLNRGEGGQNKVGSNLFDVLGVLRTLELTAADRYYGVEQRFTRVADFGYSKSADETFQKWGGHDIALGDIVRVIREFQPDVIVARFSGTSRDGHGHHEASAILAKEAFRAAADPNRFPEQMKEGLLPWQAKKFYVGNVCGFGASTCPDENYTVKLNTGQVDPVLGMSYIHFAMEGLRHQLSQGAGGWSVEPGDRFTFYKLVDSVEKPKLDVNGHEKDFFDGIDTSLTGLNSRLDGEQERTRFLKAALASISAKINEASKLADGKPDTSAGPLLVVAHQLESVIEQIQHSKLSELVKLDLLTPLRQEKAYAQRAVNLAMGVSLEAKVAAPDGAFGAPPDEKDALTVVSPGQKFVSQLKFHNGSKFSLVISDVSLIPNGWASGSKSPETDIVKPGADYVVTVQGQVPENTPPSQPYWHRANPETDSVNTVDDDQYVTLPFEPPAFQASIGYQIERDTAVNLSLFGGSRDLRSPVGLGGMISVPLVVPFLNQQGSVGKRVLAVAPAFSVMLEPGEQIIPVEGSTTTTVRVSVSCNLSGVARGKLYLALPEGWQAKPEQLPVELRERGDKQDFDFQVVPGSRKQERARILAVLEAGGKEYSAGFSLVTREDLASAYYYQPAVQRVSIVDVKVPKDLKVAYVMGAGDDIPTVLKQIGIDTNIIPAEKLASEDFGKYGTIVLGIRAYDTQKEVAANSKRLLNFVSQGGTLVVQYNAGVGDFNSGHFTPYPAQLSRTRVSVEEAPVEIVAPDDSVFHYPNEITQRDFGGWVQERGLNFMDQWDDHFKPLLASHDPGEPPQKGGMLRAHYGKGTYIYTGYAFFRQLPAGVPGAIRLFVNLLSAK